MDNDFQLFDDMWGRLSDSQQVRRVLSSMGDAVLDAMTLNIATAGHGSWPPLAPSTIAEKQRHGYPLEPLIRTWRLSQSLNEGGMDNVFDLTDTTVEVGTSTPYAIYHTGAGPRQHLPERDFSALMPSDWDTVQSTFDTWLEGN